MLEIDWNTSTILAEVFYCIIGLIFAFTGVSALKNKEVEKRTTTAIFWFILAITFIVGPYIPTWITGACIIVLAILTATGLVQPAAMNIPTAKETRENADKYGYKSFIPPVVLALSAVVVATFFTNLGANNAIGISAIVGLIVAYFIFKPKFSLPFNSFNDASLKFKYAFPPSLYFNIALLITISALFFTALNAIVL